MEDEQVLPGEVPVLSAPRGKNWCGGDSLTWEVWVILGAQGGGWGRTGGVFGLMPGMEQGRSHRGRD